MEQEIFKIENLKKYFPFKEHLFSYKSVPLKAVDGISFDVKEGEILGLVGESGCGKSTLARLLLGLIKPTEGNVNFKGINNLKKDVQIVFQDPYDSLNPKMNIGEIITEPILIHKLVKNKKQAYEKAAEILNSVGISTDRMESYPDNFSGGEQQRIGIARALASRPRVIVCDEPISSLDLSIQAQILNLLIDIQEKYNLTYVFISHDLSVIEKICDRVIVMYLGAIMEISNSKDIYLNPFHPYTEALVSAVYFKEGSRLGREIVLRGEPPSPMAIPCGCRFHTRCLYAKEICQYDNPKLLPYGKNGFVACHFPFGSA